MDKFLVWSYKRVFDWTSLEGQGFLTLELRIDVKGNTKDVFDPRDFHRIPFQVVDLAIEHTIVNSIDSVWTARDELSFIDSKAYGIPEKNEDHFKEYGEPPKETDWTGRTSEHFERLERKIIRIEQETDDHQ